MNERIKELAHQARQIGEYGNYGQIQLSPAQFEQKFAESIIHECLMKAIGAKIRGESIDTLIQNIKEDFGVEE